MSKDCIYSILKNQISLSMSIRKKILGEEHAYVAESYNNLGSVYQALGHYNEAKEYFEKALIIR